MEEELLRKTRTIRSKNIRKLVCLWMDCHGMPQIRALEGIRLRRYQDFPSLEEIRLAFHCSKRTAQDYLVACLVIAATVELDQIRSPRRFAWEPRGRQKGLGPRPVVE